MRAKALGVALAIALVAGCGGGSSTDVDSGGPSTAADDATRDVIRDALSSLPAPSGADDREQIRTILGVPDAFTLAFEPGPDGGTQRREEWYYVELGSGFELVDGRALTLVPLEASDGLVLAPTYYDPLAFDRVTTLDDVKAIVADPSLLVSTQAPPELGATLDVYAGEQLLVAFDGEGLVYVETVPLVTGGVQP